MKTIVIWGAGGGLGAAMVEYFYKKDFTVIAIVRNPAKNPRLLELGIHTIVCDATDQEQVQRSVDAIPINAWVLSTMGSFRSDVPVDYIGHRHLIDALENNNINRFLLITSLGCGDSWKYLPERARTVFGFAVREKSLAESWLQSSGLDFTILRPGGLQDGPVTGKGSLSQYTETHGLIHRSEVARLAHQLLDDKDSIGNIYQCVDPSLSV
ncbi:SDR family NAD(P)-dependent oxidoreductase [Shewanella sp. VB17]|uniref:SDR family NAD(P)-dependent oxidoreductase n=1 Tax=Shewanella sp. VB17 TaxID=2739432 RepID=UPI001563BF14|nr:SDR family NAD(P)-dependent oxidoreductase [Shewanella sp. VB17]NRD75657.1 SDR family NAD(P)-dependent oxidoreductase [Shewanella sp. VB17]